MVIKIKGERQYILIIIGLSALVWYGLRNYPAAEAKVFIGKVTAATDRSITVQLQPVGLGLSLDELESDGEMTIRVNGDTKIFKETGSYKILTYKNGKRPPGPEKFSRNLRKVDVKQLLADAAQQPVYIKIFAKKMGFINLGRFTAANINYNLDNIAFPFTSSY